MIGIVSLGNLSSIGYDIYLLILLLTNAQYSEILYVAGNLLAKVVAYIAIMMFLLDGVKIFKTRRQRAFLNSINDNKPGLPFYLVVIIFVILGGISLGYAILASISYANNLLWTLIGAYSVGIIFIGLALYLFITNKTSRQKDKTLKPAKGGLIFLFDFKHERTVYESTSNDLAQLGKLNDIYIFTEYGYLITPTNKYTVLGISVDRISDDLVNGISMNVNTNESLNEVLKEFKKYETKTIWIDDSYKITKEISK